MYINDTLQIDPLEQRVQHPKQICIKFLSEIKKIEDERHSKVIQNKLSGYPY